MALVEFDANENILRCNEFAQQGTIAGGLVECFIIENDAGNIVAQGGFRGEQQFTKVAAGDGGGLEIHVGKSFGDARREIIGGKNAFAGCDQTFGKACQIRRHYFLARAFTPGRGFPSSHSRNAPPAVEM